MPTPFTRIHAEYDPSPVAFETLGLESSLIEGIRVRGFHATTTRDIAAAAPHGTFVLTRGLGHRAIMRDPEVVRQAVDFIAAEVSR